jgi:hypothetical protein
VTLGANRKLIQSPLLPVVAYAYAVSPARQHDGFEDQVPAVDAREISSALPGIQPSRSSDASGQMGGD